MEIILCLTPEKHACFILGFGKNFVPYLTSSATFVPHLTFCHVFHLMTVNIPVKTRFCPYEAHQRPPPLLHTLPTDLSVASSSSRRAQGRMYE
jgi:hypothetical protein